MRGFPRAGLSANLWERSGDVAFVLWIIAAFLVIAGIVSILRGRVLVGVIAIIVGLLVGPGGVSLFT